MVRFIAHRTLQSGYVFTRLLAALVFAAGFIYLSSFAKLDALELSNRSVQISTSIPSAAAVHAFQFTYASSDNVGSIVFEYCENSPLLALSCTAPPGLDVDSATLTGETGNIGFSIDGSATTANKIVLTRPSAAALTVASSYNFSNITNPSTPSTTEFVRITTHGSLDGTGPLIDNGSVAFATVEPFNIETFVPPFLAICVGLNVAVDCSSATGDRLGLGDFSTAGPSFGQSQFSAGTNSISGYNIFSIGTTMTSGNNSIAAISPSAPSTPGTNQFGLNLRANAVPSVGQEPDGSGSGAPAAAYNTPNFFRFVAGDLIAASTLPTEFNRMTVSYLVNINASQAPGIYSTTLTYLATANF